MNRRQLKIKVCGMRDQENIHAIAALYPDYMGFIFHPASPRYVTSPEPLDTPHTIRRVGVFVNARTADILAIAAHYRLDTLQLHGSETPGQCHELKNAGYEIIKAFGISDKKDFTLTANYIDCCDLFLFDTRTPAHGGSGRRFDWQLLENYTGSSPFLLSGGISPRDAKEISKIDHPMLYGVDLNSRFEIETGIKDLNLLEPFIKILRS